MDSPWTRLSASPPAGCYTERARAVSLVRACVNLLEGPRTQNVHDLTTAGVGAADAARLSRSHYVTNRAAV